MRKVILYIEMGLDGYIADCRKSVDWIKGQDGSVEMPDTFSFFCQCRHCHYGQAYIWTDNDRIVSLYVALFRGYDICPDS